MQKSSTQQMLIADRNIGDGKMILCNFLDNKTIKAVESLMVEVAILTVKLVLLSMCTKILNLQCRSSDNYTGDVFSICKSLSESS